MQKNDPDKQTPKPRFSWRALTSVLITISCAVLILSGVILFVSPPGRVANWTNWNLLSLTKHDWTGLHIWFSTLFLLAAVFHLVFNWRPLVSYFKDRLTRQIGFRLEWLIALAVCGGVYAGTRAEIPPFSTFLAFNEQVKESWEQPRERAPIPHAELLTLAELAEKAGVALADATNRLHARGISNCPPDMVVQKLADQNQRSAQQIYEILNTLPAGGESAHRPAQGGAGGGMGWKTLTQFCAEEGLELKDALARLKSQGLVATPDQTLRDIAVNAGFSRPVELLELLRAKKP
jgi:hypothetical protein